jgi:hypothetical protein
MTETVQILKLTSTGPDDSVEWYWAQVPEGLTDLIESGAVAFIPWRGPFATEADADADVQRTLPPPSGESAESGHWKITTCRSSETLH